MNGIFQNNELPGFSIEMAIPSVRHRTQTFNIARYVAFADKTFARSFPNNPGNRSGWSSLLNGFGTAKPCLSKCFKDLSLERDAVPQLGAKYTHRTASLSFSTQKCLELVWILQVVLHDVNLFGARFVPVNGHCTKTSVPQCRREPARSRENFYHKNLRYVHVLKAAICIW